MMGETAKIGKGRAASPSQTIDTVFKSIMSLAEPVAGEELIDASRALGRVTAQPVATGIPLPLFDHSAMDGFGISAGDLDGPITAPLALVGTIRAGDTIAHGIERGQAVRLLTGAPIPPGVEAVVIQENCSVSDGVVEIRKPVVAGTNIRRRGEDASLGSTIVSPGVMIDARHLAILAASGTTAIRVKRRVRVALLSIGNELRLPGTALSPGQIYDVNGPMLKALLEHPAIELSDLGCHADDRTGLADLFDRAAAGADVVLSSAGISGSDADHVPSAIADAGGHAETLRMAVRPGKPLLVGRIGATPVLALPGNPVAALVNFMLLGRPLILGRAGTVAARPRGSATIAIEPIEHKRGRSAFVPAQLRGRSDNGIETVAPFRATGSARLHPLTLADGFIEIPRNHEAVEAGEIVEFHKFRAGFGT
jgi:molybdopterin molybdotransferase